jgi:hypothetical protein
MHLKHKTFTVESKILCCRKKIFWGKFGKKSPNCVCFSISLLPVRQIRPEIETELGTIIDPMQRNEEEEGTSKKKKKRKRKN